MRNVGRYNTPPGPFCNAIYLRHPSTLPRIVATLAADRIIVVFHRERGRAERRARGERNPPEVDEVVQSRKIVCAADRKRAVRGYKLNRGVSHPTRKSEFARPLNRPCAPLSPSLPFPPPRSRFIAALDNHYGAEDANNFRGAPRLRRSSNSAATFSVSVNSVFSTLGRVCSFVRKSPHP